MRHGVGIRPLHWKALFHEKGPLVLVSLPDPLRHHRVEHGRVSVGVGGGRILLLRLDSPLVQGHDVFLPRKDEVSLGIVLVPTQPAVNPTPGCRSFRGIVVADVLVVESIGQSVLSDDIKVPAIKIRVPFVFWFLEAFRKNHVGRHKTTGIRSSKHKGIFGQVGQHIPSIHPAEPVISLAAKGKILPERKSADPQRQRGGQSEG